jgi:hypothetical protein
MSAYANEFATARERDVTFFMSVVRSVFSAAYDPERVVAARQDVAAARRRTGP